MLLEQWPQGAAWRSSTWLRWSWIKRFARQEPGVIGDLGQPLVQWLERRLVLAVVHEPLGAFGVGFDLLAAPFVLLSAPAGARRIGVDQRHRGPFWKKSFRVCWLLRHTSRSPRAPSMLMLSRDRAVTESRAQGGHRCLASAVRPPSRAVAFPFDRCRTRAHARAGATHHEPVPSPPHAPEPNDVACREPGPALLVSRG